MEEVNDQNDREIDVYLDRRGGTGKTFFTLHLWERGLACVVPRAYSTASRMSAYLCSHYKGEKYIIVDIPRSGKITNELYESLEEIKDGLVFDERYHGTSRNIRGAIVIVFTNKPFKLDRLSADRWRLHGMSEGAFAPSEDTGEK